MLRLPGLQVRERMPEYCPFTGPISSDIQSGAPSGVVFDQGESVAWAGRQLGYLQCESPSSIQIPRPLQKGFLGPSA